MEKDAVSAGVSNFGSLVNTAEIKILICYIFSSINEPIPGSRLANILHYEGIANCFEVNDAISSLVKSGHLIQINEKEDLYEVSQIGKNIADTLKTTLPITVKNRAYNAALKMYSQFKNAKESDIQITKEDDKTFITCTAMDNNQPFMSVKLLVSDEEQAKYIKSKFLNDSEIYSKIIDVLTKS